MNVVAILLVVCLTGCTVSVVPVKLKPKVVYKYRPVTHRKSSNSTAIVDAKWIAEYHKLQKEHGDYTIKDDAKIEPLDNGKFRVPKLVLKHFSDLSQTTPSSTPNPEFNP